MRGYHELGPKERAALEGEARIRRFAYELLNACEAVIALAEEKPYQGLADAERDCGLVSAVRAAVAKARGTA